jgi:hypothetical protein
MWTLNHLVLSVKVKQKNSRVWFEIFRNHISEILKITSFGFFLGKENGSILENRPSWWLSRGPGFNVMGRFQAWNSLIYNFIANCRGKLRFSHALMWMFGLEHSATVSCMWWLCEGVRINLMRRRHLGRMSHCTCVTTSASSTQRTWNTWNLTVARDTAYDAARLY